jgi:hypothetical protein
MDVPPPASPAGVVQHVPLVGDSGACLPLWATRPRRSPCARSRAPCAETFFELAQRQQGQPSGRGGSKVRRCACEIAHRAARRLIPASRCEQEAAGAWNFSGVLASLHTRASALLAEEAAHDAGGATAGGVLGSGLEAMGRVAAVVGTAIDSIVEARPHASRGGSFAPSCR